MPTFTTPYEQYADREGQTIEVIRTITEPDDTHDAEVLPMHVVRFEDGFEAEAWPEEVVASLNVKTVVTAEGATFTPWTDGHAVGFRVSADDKPDRLIYLNPSTEQDGGDIDNTDVFLYSQALDGEPEPINFNLIWRKEN